MSQIPQDCVAKVAEAIGGDAHREMLDYVRKQIEKSISNDPAIPNAEKLQSAARVFAERTKLAAVILKRNAALNAAIFPRLKNYVGEWKGLEAEGVRATLTGSIRGRRAARASVDVEQERLTKGYLGGMYVDLKKAGVDELVAKGAIDLDIAKALRELGRKEPNMTGISQEAQKAARVIRKWQEVARTDANRAGAWIGKLEDWIVTQSHDHWKIHGKQQEWMADIGAKLDWNRIEMEQGPIPDKAGWLAEIYSDIVTGVHTVSAGAKATSGFQGPYNLAKTMGHERVLHFRSAEDWYSYNQSWGVGSLIEAVSHGLRRSGRNTGLMRVYGTNPEAMFNRVVEAVSNKMRADGADVESIRKFNDAAKPGSWLRNRLAEVTGEVAIPINRPFAKYAAIARSVQTLAKLGGATISSFNDLNTYAATATYQGRGYFSSLSKAMAGLVEGRPKGERLAVLAELGVFFDSMTGEMIRVGSLDSGVPGAVTKMQRLFFKLNLMDWWTESLRSSFALSTLNHLSSISTRTFDELAPDTRQLFKLYDITASDWDAMRATSKEIDGASFLTREGLPQSVGDKLSRMIVDQSNHAVLRPDADVSAMMLRGTRPGEAVGEGLRSVMQFKSYTFAYTRNIMGRAIYGHGDEARGLVSSARGIAGLMLGATVFGYLSMTAKDLIKGKKPANPDDMDGEQWRNTIQRALVQGGGAGFYGDYLFGRFNEFGADALSTAAGPLLGTANDAFMLYSKAKEGDDTAAKALKLALQNTPYGNLFWARPVLDYTVLYSWQEAMNPGYLRRMERRAMEDQGQEYWKPPSDAVQ